MYTNAAITELTFEETLTFLADKSFGRLAISLHNKPDIFPINFAIHANSADDVVVYVRTSPGNKLFATAVGAPLALETDSVEESTATSVIVYGRGRTVKHPDELKLVDSLGLEPWIAVRKPEVVTIEVEHISGRRFLLGSGPDTTIDEAPD